MDGIAFIAGMILGGLFGFVVMHSHLKNKFERELFELRIEYDRKRQSLLGEQLKLGFERGLKSKRNIIEKKLLPGGRIAIVSENDVFVLDYPITNLDQVKRVDRQEFENGNY